MNALFDKSSQNVPILGILISSRRTMRGLLDSNSRSGFFLLPAIIGILMAAPVALALDSFVAGYTFTIWSVSIALSMLSYWVYVWVYGAVYRMIGSWIGGAASNSEARLALAWSQVAFILAAAVYLPFQFVYRVDFYPVVDTSEIVFGDGTTMIGPLITWATLRAEGVANHAGISALNTVLWLTAYFISLKLLGEACQFSVRKAFAVKMIALLLHIPIFTVCAILSLPLAVLMVFLTA
jgi:hypothetical protein